MLSVRLKSVLHRRRERGPPSPFLSIEKAIAEAAILRSSALQKKVGPSYRIKLHAIRVKSGERHATSDDVMSQPLIFLKTVLSFSYSASLEIPEFCSLSAFYREVNKGCEKFRPALA